MKTLVISYSLTGNNDALAESLSRTLSAERLRVVEAKRRSMVSIAFDMAFNRTPKVALPEARIEDYDLAVFVAPVWMGKVASPLRAFLARSGPKLRSYAFVSISGGAMGPNPRLAEELASRVGKAPSAVVDLHIADLLPPEPKPDGKATMAYKLSERDLETLTAKIASALGASRPASRAAGSD